MPATERQSAIAHVAEAGLTVGGVTFLIVGLIAILGIATDLAVGYSEFDSVYFVDHRLQWLVRILASPLLATVTGLLLLARSPPVPRRDAPQRPCGITARGLARMALFPSAVLLLMVGVASFGLDGVPILLDARNAPVSVLTVQWQDTVANHVIASACATSETLSPALIALLALWSAASSSVRTTLRHHAYK